MEDTISKTAKNFASNAAKVLVSPPNPQKMTFLQRMKGFFKRLFAYLSDIKTWRENPKMWIWALVFLRLVYLVF